jgi:sortase A
MSDASLTEIAHGARAAHALADGMVERRRWRARRGLAIVLVLAGVLVLADAVLTLVWQEPISALYAKLRQDQLGSALHGEETAALTPLQLRALASLGDERSRIAYLAAQLEHHARTGDAVGRIVIPRIGVSFVVVKGTTTSALMSGPGIYSDTPFPGDAHTTAIAGHRTTYLAPFRHIDALHAGSRITLRMPYARFIYTVIGQKVVQPTDVAAAVDDVGYTRLVLSACTPLFSAAKRLLVYARLSQTVPVGAARDLPGGALARPIPASVAPKAGTTPAPATGAPSKAVLEPIENDLLPPLSS